MFSLKYFSVCFSSKFELVNPDFFKSFSTEMPLLVKFRCGSVLIAAASQEQKVEFLFSVNTPRDSISPGSSESPLHFGNIDKISRSRFAVIDFSSISPVLIYFSRKLISVFLLCHNNSI